MPDARVSLDDGVRVFGLGWGLVDELRGGQVRLVNLHEIDAHEERFAGFGCLIQIFGRRLLYVLVQERNADDAFLRGIHILAVDLELLFRLLARVAGQRSLGHPVEHGAEFRGHVGEPLRVAIGVGVQVVEKGVFHLIVALGVGQRIVRFAEMPFPAEKGLVACLFQHRPQGPFRLRQAAALALEGHRGHAAAVGDAARLHRGAARRAAWLGVEGEEGHAFIRQPFEVGRGHAAAGASSVRRGVSIPEIIGDDHDDVGFACCCWLARGPACQWDGDESR